MTRRDFSLKPTAYLPDSRDYIVKFENVRGGGGELYFNSNLRFLIFRKTLLFGFVHYEPLKTRSVEENQGRCEKCIIPVLLLIYMLEFQVDL